MLVAKKYGIITALMTLGMAFAANAQQIPVDRCGTMEVLQLAMEKDPSLKESFERTQTQISQDVKARLANPTARENAASVIIPIVFHIVMTDQTKVTDAQIMDQLTALNNDYAGLNADSTIIPAAFKPLFGKSKIQFVLAKRTPGDLPSNGIERIVTTQSVFTRNNSNIKYAASGGADAWDPSRFFNIWVCNLENQLLGYATFPGTGLTREQGVVISYGTLPGGYYTGYNKGRTLTHESGHFFFLYHIWGDDGGACSGSDGVGDTPNQSDASSGCPGGVITDACSSVAPGIMYQNYMDYSSDGCMAMFTQQQVIRMETALTRYRNSLTTSNGAVSPLKSLDAQILTIDNPYTRVCNAKFSPVVTLRNWGTETLTSAEIFAGVDNGPTVQTHWTGSLASMAAIQVVLDAVSTDAYGMHSLKIKVNAPNGGTDLLQSNDTMSKSFEYPAPVTALTEGFETDVFPPVKWDIINTDGSLTWERATGVGKTGSAAMVVRNFDYKKNGQRDYIRLPQLSITGADSAFLTFEVAAAMQTMAGTLLNNWDTLQVLVSTDCGNTYTSLYKKWGSTLITRTALTTTSFTPTANEWRKESVNLTPFINAGPVMLAFVNSTGNENNVYIDDINLYKKGGSNKLESQGWLITPNPVTGPVTVQFYTAPADLKGISLFNSTGQKLAEKLVSGRGATSYQFDMSRYASGVYVVRIVYTDHTVTSKIIKR
jgi:hypothetical protein